MSEAAAGVCPRCGAEASGRFCSTCGSPLGADAGCGSCGARLKPGALYCSECGNATAERPRKTAGAHLPWILSALALGAFSVVIALLVQRGTVPRTGDMTMTGGLPGEPGGAPSAMPSMEELAAMTPRQAADRLYERTMAEHEAGDMERSAFFIDMGLQAYAAVPPEEVDADLHFHIGMLRFFAGDSTAARQRAERILEDDPDHLLGLLLSARVADFIGDAETAARSRARFRDVVEREGGVPDRPEYQAHARLIEGALDDEE
ncbi:MAG: zinc ribbon domain-containing protein [Gemmatimonadetes bacterium]|nr:zinc ribbon domain-containing protein [Gemmatimonadota bacterium]